MWRFAAGVLAGVLFALVFVRFGWAPPALFSAPDRLRGNLIATAAEADLYDLAPAADPARRLRALEVYFANRPADAAASDADAGHPFLEALWAARARTEARQVLAAWSAHDDVLAQPALRAGLAARHGTEDDAALRAALAAEALAEAEFLTAWLARNPEGPPTPETLARRVRAAAAAP